MPSSRSVLVLLLCLVLTACSPDDEAGAPDAKSPGQGQGREDNAPREALADAASARPPVARSPKELVAQIVAAERAISDASTSPSLLAAAGHLQQVAYRTLTTRPLWDAAVRRALPKDLVRVVSDNVASRREFRSMHPSTRRGLHPDLPPWRIVPAAPAPRLLAHYREAETKFGVDWAYLAAINFIETSMGRIRGTSVAGAQGPMQFIPSTWAIHGRGDINSTHDSIMAAGRFLRAHGFTRPGGKGGALYRYNNSWAYVRGVSLVARLMQRRPRAFYGYYHWQVYYLTRFGSVLLPEGYASKRRIPVRRWLAQHPESRPDDR
ncbi:MAG: lytic transglycosylase domain-containing protein [Marmoricola sp.]